MVGFDPRSNASAGRAGRAVWAGDRWVEALLLEAIKRD